MLGQVDLEREMSGILGINDLGDPPLLSLDVQPISGSWKLFCGLDEKVYMERSRVGGG